MIRKNWSLDEAPPLDRLGMDEMRGEGGLLVQQEPHECSSNQADDNG